MKTETEENGFIDPKPGTAFDSRTNVLPTIDLHDSWSIMISSPELMSVIRKEASFLSPEHQYSEHQIAIDSLMKKKNFGLFKLFKYVQFRFLSSKSSQLFV